MIDEREFRTFVAGVLGVSSETLSFETTYGSIPEWDSMAQLRLVLELQARYAVEIPFADVTRVTSVWEFYRRANGLSRKKLVALDLDGTLWEGVVGEDGLAAIRPKTSFLTELKTLKERGVLLTILSKNNVDDVRPVFEGNMLAPLTEDDFLFPQIDWQPKAENLAALLARLNLGPEAVVFVDDNPAERLEMSARLPAVTIASFPAHLGAYFPEGDVTEEDRHKTEEYREEAARQAYLRAASVVAPDDIWSALGCWLEVHEMRADEMPRVLQLAQKANQFTLATTRYSSASDFAGARVYTVRSGDRFGDRGLVAFVVVRGAEIVEWTMSCRVAGRGLEARIWSAVSDDLARQGIREIHATWHRSGRNAPMENLLETLGFAVLSQTADCRKYARRS